jgi:zinc transport system ATP-binding protein
MSFPALASELVMTGVASSWPFAAPRKADVARALQQVGGSHLATRSVSELSGGELQRVFLARALARNPRLLILDEPATGIDVSGEADMYGVLEAFQRQTGATVLMATHDLDAAEHHASHVLLMARRQVAFGAPEAALSERNLRTAFSHVGHAHPLGMAHDGA